MAVLCQHGRLDQNVICHPMNHRSFLLSRMTELYLFPNLEWLVNGSIIEPQAALVYKSFIGQVSTEIIDCLTDYLHAACKQL